MRVTLHGWEDGAPVRAPLAAPDRGQAQAAERVDLEFGEDGATTTTITLHQRPVTAGRLASAVWDGGLALAEWAWAHVRACAPRQLTVVELGAGLGAPALAAAAAGADVVATDVPSALAGLRGGAARNWLAGKPKPGAAAADSIPTGRVTVLPLTLGGDGWRAEAAAVRGALGGRAPDLVVAADVLYPLPDPAAPRPAASDVVDAAAALADAHTRVVVAFEARPAGDPPPAALRGELLAAAAQRFARVDRIVVPPTAAFAAAPHVELYELAGVKNGVE